MNSSFTRDLLQIRSLVLLAATLVQFLWAPGSPAQEPPGPSSRRTALVISEIMYHPASGWPGADALEFVEIWNSGIITEDLTGHRLAGEIAYSFPAGTSLPPGQFLVVAKDPAVASGFYGVSCLGPFEQKLNNAGGTLQLINELGGILLQVNYGTRSPWPVAPDGTGHSLVLSRPSYGENDARAWSASDAMGGSPGQHDPTGSEPARGVVINEFLAHTDPPQVDFIELFNTGNQPVNLSGAWLSDTTTTNKFQVPNGTVIPARGFVAFTQAALGFGLGAEGEHIVLVNSNRTRVLDALAFEGQENGVSAGRFPDGAPEISRLTAPTLEIANAGIKVSAVRINEILYHPISGLEEDEYLELHNRSASAVSLGGWRIQDGISYVFPADAVIAPGGYVVVTRDAARLVARYPQLNGTNTFGNYSGTLRNSGERVALAMPDEILSNGVTNVFYITVDEVTYSDGGRWGKWSDGGGSSLELKDSRADGRVAANWGDSDESAKADWTTIDVTEALENGQSFTDEGTSAYGVANRLELFLQGDGEAVIDNIEFRNNGGANMVSNGDFASGPAGWTFGGVMRGSFVEAGAGGDGTPALHLKATGRGDTGPNKVWRALTATAAVGGANTGTVKAQVRWLRGSPHLLMRLRGNWMEVSKRLNVPANCGTPGLPNSRTAANAGPAIFNVSHVPILPEGGQAVVVSARVADPDGIGSVTLRYRPDPGATFFNVAMLDDGTAGDAVAGDGLYSATIPGRASGNLVGFHVTANDESGAASLFPEEAPARECLVRWGESVIAGSFGTYRLWVTAANIAFWTSREKNANDPIDATFVYGNSRVVYNVDTMYSGSPFHTPQYDSPLGLACDYEVNFRPDDRFLGSEPFVLTAYDVVSQNFFFHDDSAQVDLTGTWIARKLGQPYNYRRHVHVVVNGIRRGTIYDDAQQPNSEMLEEYFGEDEGGQLRKVESWFEFADNGQDQGSVYATLGRVNRSTGQVDSKRYRWNWRPRVTRDPDDWAPFTNLVAAVNFTAAPNYVQLVRTWMDVPNFLRPIITHHICGSWDSYAYDRGKNMFAYKPDGLPWRLLMWDIEIALGAGSSGSAGDSIYRMFDVTLLRMITNNPVFHREYLRGFKEAIDGPLMPGAADQALNERYAAFQQHGIPLASPQFIKTFITNRRNYLMSVVPNPPFSIWSPAFQVVNGSNTVILSGTGPLNVEQILVNGNAYPITWNSVSSWSVTVPLVSGVNDFSITAQDRYGNPVPNAAGNVSVQYTGAGADPEGHVVFNEILYAPAVEGAAFVELFNTHSNHTFDLSGWSINGLGYTFPSGSLIGPRRHLVLAEEPMVYNQFYGMTNVPFGRYSGRLDPDGETLTLLRPDATGTNLLVVDRVRYEAEPPWPATTNGFSLQLIDAMQDNSRVANWGIASTNYLPPAPPSPIPLMTYAHSWRFNQSSNLDGVAWTSPGFSDAAWLQGPGLLAFESNPSIVPQVGTVLNDPRIATGNVPAGHAYYFRTTLNVTNSLAGYVVNASVYADDGLVLYVNGTEVSPRVRMNGGAVSNATPANAQPPGSDALVPDSIVIPASLFVQGTNVIAASVHQVSPTSSDIVFGLSLTAVLTNTSVPVLSAATPDRPNAIAGALPPFPSLWLNELQANNITGPLDNFGQREPWVELHNTGQEGVSLSGYYLSDSYTNLTRWALPASGSVGAGGFSTIWCDNQTNQAAPGSMHAPFRLASGTGRVALSRVVGNRPQLIDYLTYAELPANWSYGDVPDGQPFYRRSMFFPTAGTANNGASAPLAVFINEWLADNVGSLADPADGHFEDWFELFNPGTEPADLSGCFLTDNLSDPFQFQVPNNGHYVIPPGGFLLVWADNETSQNSTNRPDLHAGFALGKGGEAIGVFAADGTLIDAVTFGGQATDVSEGRFPDGAANIRAMSTTPRLANVVPNTPPWLEPIGDKVVTIGQTLAFSAQGSDADLPVQALTYSLQGAPAGAQIGSGNGLFQWTPPSAPATNVMAVVVSDNGMPSLTATQSFTVWVAPLPVPGGYRVSGQEFRFSWAAYPGQRFQVEFKDALEDTTWLPIGEVLTGTGGTLFFTNSFEESVQRFFRLKVLP